MVQKHFASATHGGPDHVAHNLGIPPTYPASLVGLLLRQGTMNALGCSAVFWRTLGYEDRAKAADERFDSMICPGALDVLMPPDSRRPHPDPVYSLSYCAFEWPRRPELRPRRCRARRRGHCRPAAGTPARAARPRPVRSTGGPAAGRPCASSPASGRRAASAGTCRRRGHGPSVRRRSRLVLPPARKSIFPNALAKPKRQSREKR